MSAHGFEQWPLSQSWWSVVRDRERQRVEGGSPKCSAEDGPHGAAVATPADRNAGAPNHAQPWPTPTWLDTLMTYLETLNPEQRRAVEHGVAANGANIAGPVAGDCRCGLGQDQHPGAPRRAPDRQRRRSRPHPAADLLAPGRRRDGAARRAHHRHRLGRDARTGAARLVRHLPCHWCPPAAPARPCHRSRPVLHHPRPGRQRGSAQSGAA